MIIWQYCLNNKERISLAMSLGLYAGLRIGEICALKWEDIDLDNSMISITKTVQRLKSENHEHKTQLYILEPKSTSSIRSVILPDFLTEYLKKYNDFITKISLFYQIKKSLWILELFKKILGKYAKLMISMLHFIH